MAEAWWIEAEGRIWGPYASDRLATFAAEGRLTEATAIGRSPHGPFLPAGREPALATLFHGVGAIGRERPLLIVADLRATGPEALEQALAAYGPAVQVRPGLWLLRARLSASALRNAVSRRLRSEDMMLVVEAQGADAAWFNLDGDTDRALRRLWSPAPSEG